MNGTITNKSSYLEVWNPCHKTGEILHYGSSPGFKLKKIFGSGSGSRKLSDSRFELTFSFRLKNIRVLVRELAFDASFSSFWFRVGFIKQFKILHDIVLVLRTDIFLNVHEHESFYRIKSRPLLRRGRMKKKNTFISM